jgi:diguanylate cyclase (GGDEF)-like protein
LRVIEGNLRPRLFMPNGMPQVIPTGAAPNMSRPDIRVGLGIVEDRRRHGVVPLLVALATTFAVIGWLVLSSRGHGGPRVLGYLGGPLSGLAAVIACRRLGFTIVMNRSVRGFWRRFYHAAICVELGTVATVVLAATRPPDAADPPGISPWVAVPMAAALVASLLAFLHLPIGRRSALRWAQLALDGVTVALAGGLVFWYVVLAASAGEPSVSTQIGAAVVGVGSLLALVVIGKAAVSPDGPVDGGALRLLSAAPLVAAGSAVLLAAGTETGRQIVSVLAVPLVTLAICAAVARQESALRRPRIATSGRTGRSVFELLPYLAVAATTAMVVTVSADQLTWHQRAVVIGAVAIAAFVVLRQLLGLRANKLMLHSVQQQQAHLEHLAHHDPLTGLANRTRFGAALAERLRAHRPTSVLLIDIDDFKMVNDTMGHAVGDELLAEVALRLAAHTGPDDLPARLGGDEFAVLLDFDGPEQTAEAAERILAGLAAPIRVGEQLLLAHASIGVATAGPGDGADETLRNADIAMYAAKAAGKATWARFEPRMRHEVMNHARLASELHNALIRHELHVAYQPVWDLNRNVLVSVEALVRWRHPQRGPVGPDEFIPVAERTGQIVQLGSWVLRTSCEQLAAWRAEYGADAIQAVNVNVAARQLRDAGFVDEVAAVLSDTGLGPRELVLEVTESSVLDGPHVRETLQALHELGVKLALDDFGTGQSSLSLLRAFPVDILKLDKSFVDGICDGDDRGRLAVAAAVAQLAGTLGLAAVAEGIETAEQLERLREMGYKLGQGYFMARPLPVDEIGALLAAAVDKAGSASVGAEPART